MIETNIYGIFLTETIDALYLHFDTLYYFMNILIQK
jgi:hypothetical protein